MKKPRPSRSRPGNEDDPWQTRSSLLVRLGDKADQQAWAEFVERYAPMIRRWCQTWLPDEADDLVQEVLLKLLKSIGTYDRTRGRFRSWLKAVVRHLTAELRRRHALRGRGGPLDPAALRAIEAARTDLVQGLIAEHERELLDRACERVRSRVDPKTWTAFVETAQKGRRAAAVAAELGMAVASVYQARHSITKLLKQEVAALEGPM
jgi:RNA polymerase sigma-70 factor, ECF subfamily